MEIIFQRIFLFIECSLPSNVTTIGLLFVFLVLKINTAFEVTGAVVIVVVVVVAVVVVVVAGAVEVVTSADVVVSKQSKLLHGQPAGQFA